MKNLTVHFFICLFVSNIFAQEFNLQLDKKGTFKVVNWSVYGMSNTDYTKSETDANYKKLTEICEVVHKNPVMSENKGFDCEAMLYGMDYPKAVSYAIPCNLSFHFCYFYFDKNRKELRANIEPPNWSILVNRLIPFSNGSFAGSNWRPGDAVKPGFNKAKWEEANKKVNELFYEPGKKETVAPGIDRYNDEMVIVYNPNRPKYWLPVTIKEVFDRLFDLWKLDPDLNTSNLILKMLEEEYKLFNADDLKKFAYLGGRGQTPVSQVDTDGSRPAVVRPNPEYWNKKLPRSSVQILGFKCLKDKNIYRKEIEENKKNGGGYYHVNRFLNSLDILSFAQLIVK